MTLSRRDFLMRVGIAGGYGAAFSTLQALGFTPMPAASPALLEATRSMGPASGHGISVVILGGGISGLVAAYELGKLGYKCTVLEARTRPGGRNWTLRNGEHVRFTDGTSQTVSWDKKNYMNAGPARLPSIHKTMLGYCRELEVPLEVEVNTSRSTFLVNQASFNGKPIEQREVINDTRGQVAELLAKCVNKNALDAELSTDDRAKMLDFLRQYGDLSPDYKYSGSERAGVSVLPGAGPVTEKLREPLDMHALLDAKFWNAALFEEEFDMQATMFQPVGGMDRIPYAFAKKLGSVIQYDSPVTEIRRATKGVRIGYTHHGIKKSIHADYCFCGMPVSQLQKIPNDFSPRIQQAIADTGYDDAFKIGWESQRFWERDFNIYGGISWLVNSSNNELWSSPEPVNLVWYPSGRMFSETGVVLSGYAVEHNSGMAALTALPDKFAASRQAVERLHPGYGSQLKKPIYVNWGRIPYNEGSWVSGTPRHPNSTGPQYYAGPYNEFTKPDSPFFFVGDHCSHIIGWQEGAALSSLRAIQLLGDQVRVTRTA
jgi:monoamine oxidase